VCPQAARCSLPSESYNKALHQSLLRGRDQIHVHILCRKPRSCDF
jgi:hypothetical protein